MRVSLDALDSRGFHCDCVGGERNKRERRRTRGSLSSWVALTRKEQLCHMEVKSNGKVLILHIKEKKEVKAESDIKESIQLGSHQSP